METGKIPTKLLEEIVLKPIEQNQKKRKEIKIRPKTGEDCSAVDLEGELCVLSTDPITGAKKDAAYLAVHINCNDAASSGAEPVGILLTALLPPESTKEEFADLMKGAYQAANELNIEILGGHTEVTKAVTQPIISGTVIGKTKNKVFISSSGAKEGQKVIMTKWAGLEGTSILANEQEEILSKKMDFAQLKEAKSFLKYLSVVKEGLIARDLGATAMHDATEGGILGAVWEVADCSDTGVLIYEDKIPLREETKTICRLAHIDPLRLISSGSMIITSFQAEELVEKLKENGIPAAVIGEITKKEKQVMKNGVLSVLEEPKSDELYHAYF